MSLRHDFAELFQGRMDAYGTDEGGCERGDGTTFAGSTVEYQRRVGAHLQGHKPMGIYPVRSDNTCRWGCIDWDTEDAWEHAVTAWEVYSQLGVQAWIERSRSKGFHVWVFSVEPTPASVMRKAGLAVCQIGGCSAKEVNPKQEVLLEGQLGNYVRLPYPGAAVLGVELGDRQVVLSHDGHADCTFGPISVHQFVNGALDTRTNRAKLEEIANLYQAPPVIKVKTPDPSSLEGNAVKRMSGLAYTVWQNGPLDGADRSSTMFKLVSLLREGGKHTEQEAWELLCDAHDRWGHKFAGREDQLHRLFTAGWAT